MIFLNGVINFLLRISPISALPQAECFEGDQLRPARQVNEILPQLSGIPQRDKDVHVRGVVGGIPPVIVRKLGVGLRHRAVAPCRRDDPGIVGDRPRVRRGAWGWKELLRVRQAGIGPQLLSFRIRDGHARQRLSAVRHVHDVVAGNDLRVLVADFFRCRLARPRPVAVDDVIGGPVLIPVRPLHFHSNQSVRQNLYPDFSDFRLEGAGRGFSRLCGKFRFGCKRSVHNTCSQQNRQ